MNNELTKLETVALVIVKIEAIFNPPLSKDFNEAFTVAQQFLDASPDKVEGCENESGGWATIANLRRELEIANNKISLLDKQLENMREKELAKEQLTGFKGVKEEEEEEEEKNIPPLKSFQQDDMKFYYCDAVEIRSQWNTPSTDDPAIIIARWIYGLRENYRVAHMLLGQSVGKEQPSTSDLVWQALEACSRFLFFSIKPISAPEFKHLLEIHNDAKDLTAKALKLCETDDRVNAEKEHSKILEQTITDLVAKPSVPNEVVEKLNRLKSFMLPVGCNYVQIVEDIIALCTTPYVDPRVKELVSMNQMLNEMLEDKQSKIKQLESHLDVSTKAGQEMTAYIGECETKIKQLETQRDEASSILEFSIGSEIEGNLKYRLLSTLDK